MRLSAMAALFLVACGKEAAPPAAPAAGPVPVVVQQATQAPLDRTVEAVGVVAARESVEIRPEMSGVIQSTSFEDGASVKRGAVLARLRDADQRAALLDANAREQLAKVELDRARALYERQDGSKAALDQAEASWTLARAAVEKAEEALRRTVITAPFDGVVGIRQVSVGQTVDPTRVVTRIDALDQLVVDLSVPETLLGQLSVGLAASVTADPLGDAVVPASVSYVAPRVRDDTRTLDLRVSLPSDGRLRPGVSARVRVVLETVPNALRVPSQAVVPTGNGPALWLMGEDGKASLRPVTTGERTPETVEVTSGLNAGENVIIEGLSRMRPGAAVVVQGDAAGAPSGAPAK